MSRRSREPVQELPPVLQTPEDEVVVLPRAVFVLEFVRIKHLGVLGEAFASQLRGEALVAKQPPEKRPVAEWESLFQEWLRKTRG